MKLHSEQRLKHIFIISNYQTMISIILKSNKTNLLKLLFDLTHFHTSYLDTPGASEYQSVKKIMGDLDHEFFRTNMTDTRMKECMNTYKELVKQDFSLEKTIRNTDEQFHDISTRITDLFSDISQNTESLLTDEFRAAKDGWHLMFQFFLISMSLSIMVLMAVLF